ncbi:MAG TPA: hypothetical protein DCX54_09270, partial [Flavobacteriales bacterium]|nr:hypothetical protein [Flavobacteriales bacterium]
TQADAESPTQIELYVKEAKILSTHSEKSYHFEGEDKVESLVIDNPELFWEASKFLVIEVIQ